MRKALHLVKRIASNRGHARVKAFIVTKHPFVEVGRYVRPQRAAFHRLVNFFWRHTTDFQYRWCARRRYARIPPSGSLPDACIPDLQRN